MCVASDDARGLLTEELGEHGPHLTAQLVAVQCAAKGELANPFEVTMESLTDGLFHRGLEQCGVLVLDCRPERFGEQLRRGGRWRDAPVGGELADSTRFLGGHASGEANPPAAPWRWAHDAVPRRGSQ